jgi:hypothetical protein
MMIGKTENLHPHRHPRRGCAMDTASAAQIDLLSRQIGQLKAEYDFLSRKLSE